MVYWISTGLLSGLLILSALTYLLHAGTIEGVRELGFPDFFRVQLAVLKLAAAVALVVPVVPRPMKQWAYAGVALFLLTAIVAHAAHGDSFVLTLINLGIFGIVAASYKTLPSASR